MRILIIEDDLDLAEALELALSSAYTVELASSFKEVANRDLQQGYELILLDLQLPDGNGLDFITKLRQTTTIPIIILSVLNDEATIIRGLDLGADDYLTKPFELPILLSRIRSVCRRTYGSSHARIHYGALCLDLEKQTVTKNQQPIHLTPIETSLFFALAKASGRILIRDYLIEKIWEMTGNDIEDNTLSVHMRRLKAKIGEEWIQTRRHIGYCFIGEDHEKSDTDS